VKARVKWRAKVTTAELKEAERALGVALPPSYREFVRGAGTFVSSGALTGRGGGNDTVLFTPAEIVKQTKRYRKELSASSDEDGKQILNDGIVFCADPRDEYFHLFVISGARKNGEMKTRAYDYQDPATTDPWHEGDGTFASVIDGIITRVRDQALEEAG
jgi:hypothetical protein